MLLLDALRQAECSICLQSFFANKRSSASPTPSTTPQKTQGPNESLQISSPLTSAGTELRQAQEQTVNESGFRIVFAPGVQETEGSSDGLKCVKEGEGSSLNARDEESVVVLPCGHFLHYLCALQLHEYKDKTACPICRQALSNSTEFVVFRPQQRPPHFIPCASHDIDGTVEVVAGDIPNTADDASGSEVEVTGVRHGTAVEVYIHHLEREVEEFRRRRQTIRSREKHLTVSKEHLKDQCLAIEQFLVDAKRRYEVLAQSGGVGTERLLELRDTARETNASLSLLTAELAALMRDQLTLNRQLEKYSRKLQQFRAGDKAGVKRRSKDSAADRQVQKRNRSGP